MEYDPEGNIPRVRAFANPSLIARNKTFQAAEKRRGVSARLGLRPALRTGCLTFWRGSLRSIAARTGSPDERDQ